MQIIGGGNLLATIDFENGDYSIGETSYALADAVETDLDWAAAFNPSDVTADVGYSPSVDGAGGKLKGPFETLALARNIFLVDLDLQAGGLARLLRPDAVANTEDAEVAVDPSIGQLNNEGSLFPETVPGVSAGAHLFAVYFGADAAVISVDGGAAIVSSGVSGAKVDFAFRAADATIRSIKIYDGSGVTTPEQAEEESQNLSGAA